LKKCFYKFLLIIIISLVVLTTVAGAAEINCLNLKNKSINDKNMVSLRELGNKFGWNFYFENSSKEVFIDKGDKNVVLKINQNMINGNKLAVAPIIYNGRTYISINSTKLLLQEFEQGAEQMLELLTCLSVNKNKCVAGEKIKATIELLNISNREITLKYASGQLYDLYLSDTDKEVWRWSKGKFFTMALIKKELPAGEKLKYEVEVPIPAELTPGKYILGGKIATKNSLKLNEVEIDVCK